MTDELPEPQPFDQLELDMGEERGPVAETSHREPPRRPSAVRREARRGWFFIVTVEAADVLREHFPTRLEASDGKRAGKRLPLKTARAIYVAFTEVANEARSLSTGGAFTAHREYVAARAGVGVRTLDMYVRAFEEAGLLEVKRIRSGRRHQANVWQLPYAHGAVRGAASDTSKDLEAQPATPPTAVRGAASDTLLKKNVTQENDNVVRLGDRSRVPSAREERQARRARRAAALDSLIDQGSG